MRLAPTARPDRPDLDPRHRSSSRRLAERSTFNVEEGVGDYVSLRCRQGSTFRDNVNLKIKGSHESVFNAQACWRRLPNNLIEALKFVSLDM